MKKSFLIFGISLASIFLAAFAPWALAGQKVVRIAAASDLSFALKEIARGFEASTGVKTVISLGSTGNFAAQIENGAPFDVFMAANVKYIDDLGKKGLIEPGTKTLYARGRIVLAINRKTGMEVKTLETLLDPAIKRVAIANPDHAPYGTAAREALTSTGIWEKVRHKVVYGENIRQALQYVQTGDCQAGIIALSVAQAPEVRYQEIPESLHKPIDQAAAVVKGAQAGKDAVSFIRYVKSPEGIKVLKKYGFGLPGESR